jgi:hypothetical protein
MMLFNLDICTCEKQKKPHSGKGCGYNQIKNSDSVKYWLTELQTEISVC